MPYRRAGESFCSAATNCFTGDVDGPGRARTPLIPTCKSQTCTPTFHTLGGFSQHPHDQAVSHAKPPSTSFVRYARRALAASHCHPRSLTPLLSHRHICIAHDAVTHALSCMQVRFYALPTRIALTTSHLQHPRALNCRCPGPVEQYVSRKAYRTHAYTVPTGSPRRLSPGAKRQRRRQRHHGRSAPALTASPTRTAPRPHSATWVYARHACRNALRNAQRRRMRRSRAVRSGRRAPPGRRRPVLRRCHLLRLAASVRYAVCSVLLSYQVRSQPTRTRIALTKSDFRCACIQ